MASSDVLELAVDELQPGRYQPRLQLREAGARRARRVDSRARRAATVDRQGACRRRKTAGRESLTRSSPASGAGERRGSPASRPCPCIVRELTDQSALAVALIENLQREDLNPIDQARSMSRLIEEFELTHEEIAKALGRSRASRDELLAVARACRRRQGCDDGRHDRHGPRASAAAARRRSGKCALARKVVRLGWSVRKVEKTVKALLETPAERPEDARPRSTFRRAGSSGSSRASSARKSRSARARRAITCLQLGFADLANLETSLQKLQDLVRQIRAAAGPRARDAARDPKARGGES